MKYGKVILEALLEAFVSLIVVVLVGYFVVKRTGVFDNILFVWVSLFFLEVVREVAIVIASEVMNWYRVFLIPIISAIGIYIVFLLIK